MKAIISLLGLLLVAVNGVAQTNAIAFPQLLSATNSVLMTNAEFRCFVGDKVFFKNDNGRSHQKSKMEADCWPRP